MRSRTPLVVASVLVFLPAVANASPITLNFTTATYSGVNGTPGPVNVVDQGVTLTFTATNGNIVQGIDGLGIDGPGGDVADEISRACFGSFPTCLESLQIGISPAVTLYQIYISRLFPNQPIPFSSGTINETGTYQINGGAPVQFVANSATGQFTIDFGPTGISNVFSLTFSVPDQGSLHDYVVTGLSVEGLQVVPEPGAMVLLGSGLIGMAVVLRRRLGRSV